MWTGFIWKGQEPVSWSVNITECIGYIKGEEFLYHVSIHHVSKWILLHSVV